MDICTGEMPPERKLKAGHIVRCWLHENVPPGKARKIHPSAETEPAGAGGQTRNSGEGETT
jgi:hypothetical protein